MKLEHITYEPKHYNRWVVNLPEHFNLPSYTIHYMSEIVYNVNERKWDDLVIKLYDPVTPSTSKSLIELINSGKLHNFEFMIVHLGPVGDEVETIKLKGSLDTISFGDFDYGKSEPRINTLTIKLKSVNR